jgi:hypothetical protein
MTGATYGAITAYRFGAYQFKAKQITIKKYKNKSAKI